VRVDRERLPEPPSGRWSTEAPLDHGAVEDDQAVPNAEPERRNRVAARRLTAAGAVEAPRERVVRVDARCSIHPGTTRFDVNVAGIAPKRCPIRARSPVEPATIEVHIAEQDARPGDVLGDRMIETEGENDNAFLSGFPYLGNPNT